jgi:glycerophosphoryl diester phosphodiesterase
MKIIPWTVNDLPTMVQLKKMGVDGLISDYPNIFIELSKQ